MVAARAELLGAGPLRLPVTDAVVAAAGARCRRRDARVSSSTSAPAPGTTWPPSSTPLPGHRGLALDVSKAAARRAARAHPRAGAVVADVWRGLPVADGCADLVLNVFAPRNGAEFHRVLRPGGTLVVVTPRAGPPRRTRRPARAARRRPGEGATRLDRSLGAWFELDQRRGEYACSLGLRRDATARLVAMGPSAWHTEPAELRPPRSPSWPEPVTRDAPPSDVRTLPCAGLDGSCAGRGTTGRTGGRGWRVPRSVIGRVGRWCFRHWGWVLAVWVLAVAAGVARDRAAVRPARGRAACRATSSRSPPTTCSTPATTRPAPSSASSTGVDPTAPAGRATRSRPSPDAGRPRRRRPRGRPPVRRRAAEPERCRLPRRRAGRARLGRRSAELDRTARDATVTAVVDRAARAGRRPAGRGDRRGRRRPGAEHADQRTPSQEDLQRAEYISLPMTLIVLVIVFGGLVAAGLPVLTAAVSVAAAMGVHARLLRRSPTSTRTASPW